MADTKLAYGSSAALTITLASLATSATHLTGRESTAVVNTTNLYLDYLLAGKITLSSTTPTAGQIQVWVYGQQEDTPTYPDGITGIDAGISLTSENVRNSALRLAAVLATGAFASRTHWIHPLSIRNLFGGIVPKRWGVFVTHNTVQNLHTTAGNHALWHTPVYSTTT